MSLFSNMKTDGLEEAEDRLGGYRPIETGIYSGTIKAAYAGKSPGGAQNVTLLVDLGDREYRETIYITNKKGENWFPNKDDPKKKVPLPGFVVVDDICQLASGKPLCEQEAEDKVVKVYDLDAKKELPKSVPTLVDLIGQPISLGIVQQLENKSQKQGDEYVATAETRTTNFIDKVFHTETRLTVVEAKRGLEKGEFWVAWEERNKGQVRDKRTIKEGDGGGQSGLSGRPGASRTPSGPPLAGGQSGTSGRPSLFGKKTATA